MKPVELTLSVEINASQQEVFNKVVDWESQGEWMLGTKVKGTKNNGQGLGGEINAWTGFWKIGFNDPMVITQWVEPKVVDVTHLGKIVKGTGSMIVEKIDEKKSRAEMSFFDNEFVAAKSLLKQIVISFVFSFSQLN